MAINYNKVGWDTTKYVNPTNMNQMDNGIKAACDGVDAIDETIGVPSTLPSPSDDICTNISEVNSKLSELGNYHTQKTGSTQVANVTSQVLDTVEFEKGMYLVEYDVQFAKNQNGYRSIFIGPTASASQTTATSINNAGNDIPTRMQKVRLIKIDNTVNVNFYAMHNSGVELAVNYTINAIKLA